MHCHALYWDLGRTKEKRPKNLELRNYLPIYTHQHKLSTCSCLNKNSLHGNRFTKHPSGNCSIPPSEKMDFKRKHSHIHPFNKYLLESFSLTMLLGETQKKTLPSRILYSYQLLPLRFVIYFVLGEY